MKIDYHEGALLLVDKPFQWTSFDVVNKIRRESGVKKVGHAGTLDPLATGLLIICTGKKTKQIEEYQRQVKEYTGVIMLGAITPTYDAEFEPTETFDVSALSEEEVIKAAGKFIGEIEQIPPIYSAIKKDGIRAYELARKGEDVKMEPRKVTIEEFEITKVNLPEVHFRVVCSTGTYIRSLAHDFGKYLNNGGYLKSLVRTRIGDYSLDDAWKMRDLVEHLRENKKI